MRRYILFIILLVCIIPAVSTVSSAQQATSRQLTIHVDDWTGIGAFPVEITRHLKKILAEHQINLTITYDSDGTAAIDAELEFGYSFDAPQQARFFTAINNLESPIAAISSALQSPSSIGFWWDDDPQTSARRLASGLLYYLGSCNEADALLNTIQSDNHQNDFDNYDDHLMAFLAGNCAIMDDDYETAIENLTIIRSRKYYAIQQQAETNLAWVYIQRNQPQNAFDVMDAAVNRYHLPMYDQQLQIALVNRARIHALIPDYTKATDDLTAAIELSNNMTDENPHDQGIASEKLYTLRGEIYLLRYEWDNALSDFDTALDYDPEYAPAYFQRGVLYYTMAQRERALSDFQMVLELAPDAAQSADAQRYIDSIKTELDTLGG